MSAVQVVDRGAREIVVFLSGDVSGEPADTLHAAVDEVSRLEQLNALDHVVVDMHRVTELGDAGVAFLRELSRRGRTAGYEVSFAAMSGPAHRAVEAAGWRFAEHSPLLDDRT
ncbi:STAS domain-containing protein [Jiangella gansuensis]|uniref:STAS domain-containing protein n=1 Tax=Jiangella gansuensis TaxID=281473 RepID=UPI00047B7675|nr:STAS domain-containing protein [Jiangella gansuensis]